MPFDYEERQLGVIVWENVFADIPFPENAFCGLYDEHWGEKEGFRARNSSVAGSYLIESCEPACGPCIFLEMLYTASAVPRNQT